MSADIILANERLLKRECEAAGVAVERGISPSLLDGRIVRMRAHYARQVADEPVREREAVAAG